MSTRHSDTHPDAEKFQISLIRSASVAERLLRARSLSSTVIELSRRAISRANPELSEQELNLVLTAHYYGKELVERLREYFRRKAQ